MSVKISDLKEFSEKCSEKKKVSKNRFSKSPQTVFWVLIFSVLFLKNFASDPQ